MAFNQLSSKILPIFLDNKYSPQEDIRLFVNAEFLRIKSSHPSAGSLPHNWPPASDVDDIVETSSDQFIYAAAVMNYIGHASTVPTLSLQRVKGIIPPANNTPFTRLDSIYTCILSRADDLEATRSILSMKLLGANSDLVVDASEVDLLQAYDSRFTDIVIESCIAELSAIAQLTEYGNLEFYHASMTDHLLDRSRSGVHWIDIQAFHEKALVAFWHTHTLHLIVFPLCVIFLTRLQLDIMDVCSYTC